MITIPIARQRAAEFKSGDSVILCGRPTFHPSADNLLFGDGLAPLTNFTSFRMLPDSRCIGYLAIDDPSYDIYDPKSETVQ